MLVNKVTKMHYLFFSHLFISASILCHPRIFIGKSLSSLIVFQRNIFSLLVGKTTSSTRYDKIFTSHLSPKTLTPFHDAKFSFNVCIWLFFFSSILDLSHTETSSLAMDSWFVYQNIDLFSLYTSTFAPLLVHSSHFPLCQRLCWWAILILTSTCLWSSHWQQEGQERDGAVVIWKF